MSFAIATLSSQQLRRAAELKDKIQSLEKELGRILALEPKAATSAKKSSKRKMSAATRAKIAAAAKARWAKVKARKK